MSFEKYAKTIIEEARTKYDTLSKTQVFNTVEDDIDASGFTKLKFHLQLQNNTVGSEIQFGINPTGKSFINQELDYNTNTNGIPPKIRKEILHQFDDLREVIQDELIKAYSHCYKK